MREMFQESHLRLSDLALPIFVEEGVDDYVPINAMPGVMRIPEKRLAYEIERIAKAGIRSVMTFGIVALTRMQPAAMHGMRMAWWRVCRVSAKTPCQK